MSGGAQAVAVGAHFEKVIVMTCLTAGYFAERHPKLAKAVDVSFLTLKGLYFAEARYQGGRGTTAQKLTVYDLLLTCRKHKAIGLLFAEVSIKLN